MNWFLIHILGSLAKDKSEKEGKWQVEKWRENGNWLFDEGEKRRERKSKKKKKETEGPPNFTLSKLKRKYFDV